MLFFSQIMRDPETGNSRGFGFISYDSFEASDAAIEVIFSFDNISVYVTTKDVNIDLAGLKPEIKVFDNSKPEVIHHAGP